MKFGVNGNFSMVFRTIIFNVFGFIILDLNLIKYVYDLRCMSMYLLVNKTF